MDSHKYADHPSAWNTFLSYTQTFDLASNHEHSITNSTANEEDGRRTKVFTFASKFALDADDHEFFRYTSARWLRNDNIERQSRYVRFDVNALCDIAATSCGADKCTGIKKLDEGGFNRAFLLRFDNDTEAVARIPFHIAGPPHLLTASEVATLDFVRNVMNIPAPKVLVWSSRAGSTPVGSEFIVLEKVNGVQLPFILKEIGDVDEKINDVFDVLLQMLNTDRKFATFEFAMHGSLFYKEDVAEYPHTTKIFADESQESELTRKFAIGPHMSWELWRDERKQMDVDRGPWKTPVEYMTGIIRCQQEWLRRFAKPRRLEDPTYRSAENNNPKRHIEALEDCLKAMPNIIPGNYTWPAIWHPDLHKKNMFVTKDAPHTLSGIIDWQFTGISPFFHQVKMPKAFRYYGSRIELPEEDNEKVRLPDNYDSLPGNEKKLVDKEMFEACVHAVYETATKTHSFIRPLLDHPDFPMVIESLSTALDSWNVGLEELRFHLLVIAENWENIAEDGKECPLHYGDEEKSRILREFRRHAIYQKNFARLCDKIGIAGYSCIRSEHYEEVLGSIQRLKPGWDEAVCGGPYPFEIEDGQSSGV